MKKIFIDGGANVGSSIKLFLSKYPNAKGFEIHSFEANPNVFKTLEKNKGNATTYNIALYNQDTQLDFYIGNSLSSSIRSDKTTGSLSKTPIKVEAIDLARFIKLNFSEEDYIVLKLDVEGAEYDILPHLLDEGIFDGWCDELFGEWHHNKLKMTTSDEHLELVKRLKDKGFSMRNWSAEQGKIEL